MEEIRPSVGCVPLTLMVMLSDGPNGLDDKSKSEDKGMSLTVWIIFVGESSGIRCVLGEICGVETERISEKVEDSGGTMLRLCIG